MNEQSQISRRQGSQSEVEVIIRKAIVRIAEICGKELTQSLVLLWIDNLKDLSAETLTAAFRRIEQTCHFFPTPGDVRETIVQTTNIAEADLAEKAWQKVLRELERYTPDIPGGPIFTQPVEYAVKAAGGIRSLYEMDSERLVWAKKAFVESFLRWFYLSTADQALVAPAKSLRELGLAGQCEQVGCKIIGPHDHKATLATSTPKASK